MTWYTLIAGNATHRARPCGIVAAGSTEDALRVQRRLSRLGYFAFLPHGLHFTARRSSRLEIAAYRAWMLRRLAGGEAAVPDERTGGGFGGRDERRRMAFFEWLWRNEGIARRS